MWQVALAAAVAGSGIFATKKLINTNNSSHQQQEHSLLNPNSPNHHFIQQQQVEVDVDDEKCEIFRFSSSKTNSRRKKKKLEIGTRRNGNVCLKKRRTSINATENCGLRSSQDSPVFGYGVGVGIMYMMSAGKAEINKLNTAMDETAKVVQELKAELYKRKSSHSLQVSGFVTPKIVDGKCTPPVFSNEFIMINDMAVPVTEDGECASSLLTEEPGPKVLEMNQLEAELESELQKLSCCSTVASGPEGITSDFYEETEFSDDDHYAIKEQNPSSNQCHGIKPMELDRKLSHLLIGQQESQIVELESELQSAHAKLHEKESELQALKDCVRRLTEFSLSSASDNEVEERMDQDTLNHYNDNKKMAAE